MVILGLKLSAEGLVQQRLFQLVERGEFALVNGFEAFGFVLERIEICDDCLPLRKRWRWNRNRIQ